MTTASRPEPETKTEAPGQDAEPLRTIAEALRGLQFGSITVIVQDGIVIQVDRTEKRRLTRRS
jgi:hypothetical protein